MADASHKPATYADLEAVPEHLVAEILFGHLVTHPRHVRRHGGAASVLGMAIGGPFQLKIGGPGGWVKFSLGLLWPFDQPIEPTT